MVAQPTVYEGDLDAEEVTADLDSFQWSIDADLPAFLSTGDHSYRYTLDDHEYRVILTTRMAGEAEYSTFPGNRLPKYTHVQIVGPALDEIPRSATAPDKDEVRPSREMLDGVANRLFRASELVGRKVVVEGEVGLSYTVSYMRRGSARPELTAKYFYDRTLEMGSSTSQLPVPPDIAQTLFDQAMEVGDRFAKRLATLGEERTFPERVFELIHEFAYYARQHPAALQSLDEASIRDLFLVAAKMVFQGSAEAEAYHFDGKLDFKIRNPSQGHETVTGEFKWWAKQESIQTALHQATVKHATGQEAAIHILMLSKNIDQQALFEKLTARVSAGSDCLSSSSGEAVTLPNGSKELVRKYKYDVRGEETPLYLWLVQLRFEKC